jgi:predicted CopG family antitoxin
MDTTTITIDLRIKKILDSLKKARRESYNDVLSRVLSKKDKEDADSMNDTISILSDPEVMASLARSLNDIKKVKLYDIDEV